MTAEVPILLNESISRPQSVGDAIGRAIRLYRLHLKEWLPHLIWPSVIVAAGRIIMQLGAFMITQHGPHAGFGLLLLLLGCVVAYIGFWFLLIKVLGFVRVATGFSNSLPEALKHVKESQWTLLGAVLLGIFILISIFVLWILELIASGFLFAIMPWLSIFATIFGVCGMLISGSFAIYCMTISLCAIACEAGSITAMISRGFSMGSKSFFRTLAAGIAIGVTVQVLATPLWIPPIIIIAIDALRIAAGHGSSNIVTAQPFYWQVMNVLWKCVVDMLCWPIMFIAFGYYYYDLRLRFEGIDVLTQLDQLRLKNLE